MFSSHATCCLVKDNYLIENPTSVVYLDRHMWPKTGAPHLYPQILVHSTEKGAPKVQCVNYASHTGHHGHCLST